MLITVWILHFTLLGFPEGNVEAHVVRRGSPVCSVDGEDRDPGDQTHQPHQGPHPAHHHQLLDRLLTLKLRLPEGLLVEPDGVDSPEEGQESPAEVEIFLAA